MYAVVEIISATLAAVGVGGPPGIASGSACAILVLCGLLELRRRVDPRTSRWLVVGGALQLAAATTAVANFVLQLVVPRSGWTTLYQVTIGIQLGCTLCFVIALITAARAWRSALAPVALVAALAWRTPLAIALSALGVPFGTASIRLSSATALVVTQLLLLALYGRLGAAAAPPTARVDAERAARRVASWLYWRVALAAVLGGLVTASMIEDSQLMPREIYVGIAQLVAAAVVGELVGLVGLARARIAGLSPAALCAVAFVALWEVLVAVAAPFSGPTRGVPTALLGLTVWFIGACCVVWVAVAARRFAVRSGDRALRAALSRRIAGLVVFELLRNAAPLGAPLFQPEVHWFGPALAAWGVVVKGGAMLVLASVFACLARALRRAQVAAESDAAQLSAEPS
jgi:hypothetical protein